MSEKKIEIGGRLHSIATGNVLAGANEIFDDDKNKKQSEINTETYSLVNDVNERLNGLSPDQQSALTVAAKATNNETKLGYYVCGTEGNVAAKVISDATGYILSKGGSMKVKMTNANTAANATLNINSTGAKPLYYDGERASVNNSWEAGETVEVYYDGTNYYANNVAGGSGSGDGAFDISAKTGQNYETLTAALTAANTILPASKKKGGMSIKFIQTTPAKYTVIKTEGATEQPTGTELQSDPGIISGTYTAGELSSFSTLPATLNSSLTYYLTVVETVDEQEVTTYTTWVITYVQSSDNSYVQHRLMAASWSINPDDWAIADESVYAENPEFVYVKTDSEGKILWAIKTNGSIYYGAGVPPQVIDYINEKIAELSLDEYEDIVTFLNNLEKGDKTLQKLLNEKVDKVEGKSLIDEEVANGTHYEENPEWIYVLLDEEDRILAGLKSDGSVEWSIGIPTPIKTYIDNAIAEIKNGTDGTDLDGLNKIIAFLSDFSTSDTLKDLLDTKVDKEEGKALIDSEYAASVHFVENSEFIAIWLDKDEKILFGLQDNGNFVFGSGVPEQIVEFVNSVKDGLTSIISTKVSKTEGKSLIDDNYVKEVEDNGYVHIVTDKDDRILLGIKEDGDIYFGKLPSQIEDNLKTPFHGGVYMYPGRILTGKRYYWFKDVVFSGLKPIENYEVIVKQNGYLKNYSKKTLSFIANSAGSYVLEPVVKDINNTTVDSKKVVITAYDAPEEKLANSDAIDVFFMGDSLIANNDNLIGKEFRRMLSLNEQQSTDVTGALKLATLNICPNKINLIGESGRNGTRYQFVYRLGDIFINKRDIPYGSEEATGTYWQQNHNPFYNPDSTEPDELDENGMNKRVDFIWYFRNACGEGKYPKLIYIGIGANDSNPSKSEGYGNFSEADIPFLKLQGSRIVALCKKIKSACDTIAGGNSGLVIKIMNHQTHAMWAAFEVSGQPAKIGAELRGRLINNIRYNYIYDAITDVNNGVSDYVDFIDAASHFDPVNGFHSYSVNTNVRTTSKDDMCYEDSIHMNNVGAYNYADIIIDDFIADSRFD